LPYIQTYKVDYINMSRDSITKPSSILSNGGLDSDSQVSITNTAKNHFWETLEKNINALLLTEERLTITRRKQLKSPLKQ
jgi:hypothetical protein